MLVLDPSPAATARGRRLASRRPKPWSARASAARVPREAAILIPSESEAFARWLVAAADGFAEGAAFHFQAAAAAKRRSDSGPDEQGPHQAGPENHVRHEKLTRHTGRYRPVGRRGLAFEAQLE